MNRRQFISVAASAALATLVCAYAIAVQHVVRQVNAEDECAFNTYAVERLPFVGLVCIGE